MIGTNFLGFLLTAAILSLSLVTVLVALHRKRQFSFAMLNYSLIAILLTSIFLFLSSYQSTILNLLWITPFSLFFSILFSIGIILVNLLAYGESKEYPTFALLLSIVSMGVFIVVFATSVLELFVGLEITILITSFLIITSEKRGTEPAVKFFLVGCIAAALTALAIALTLPLDATLSLTPAVLVNPLPYSLALPIVLFIAGISFEAGIFPFNLWIPDVYQGSKTYITALLSGINKKVALVATIEVFFILFIGEAHIFSNAFATLAVLTMFFGNILASKQENVKRMFAYSSISQAGYILVGLAAADVQGLTAAIFYIAAHSFMIIGAFAIVMWLESNRINTVSDYKGLYSRNVFGAVTLTLLMLSMAGVPPLIGFAGKFLLFSSAIGAGFLIVAILAVLNSVISMYYYGRLMNNMFTSKKREELEMGRTIFLVVLACIIVVVAFGLYPQPLISAATLAAKSIGLST
jgi:proton-translocating NADH-quinone oxidoreductase chain N